MFLLHVMSVPALIRHLEMLAPETVPTLAGADLFAKSLELLSNDQVRTFEPSDSWLSLLNFVFKESSATIPWLSDSSVGRTDGRTGRQTDRPSYFR